MGRGKRVSEWPGNVHFRQVVNRYREEYATSERANKVKIAAAVIAAVQDVGGRFVREVPGGGSSGGRSSWYVVTHDRAVEKTCRYYLLYYIHKAVCCKRGQSGGDYFVFRLWFLYNAHGILCCCTLPHEQFDFIGQVSKNGILLQADESCWQWRVTAVS